MRREPLVDFIGIGVGKSATSWISACLSEHPEILMSRPKETYFFGKHFRRGFDWYESCFKHCHGENLRGEYTPGYLLDPEVIDRIHTNVPEAKLIVCLRKPIDKLTSAYYFSKARGVNKETPEEGILGQAEQVKYAKLLQPYLETFGRDRVLILFFDDIKTDSVAFVRKIFTFLGVDDSFVPPSAYKKRM